jgi:hypothetical protein
MEETKMRKFGRFMFVLCVLFNLVFSQIIVSVVALDDDYGTEYRVSYYEIPYGNGIDDDGDGVIDNIGEPDVVFGEKNITKDDRVINTWSDTFVFPSPREYGVEIGGPFDRLYEVSINAVDAGSSVAPIYSCYIVDEVNESLNYTIKTNVINMASFYMSIDPTGLMNGASEIWYRSAIVWEETTYLKYYLNIFDDTGALIYATTTDSFTTTPTPYVVTDNSGYERIYQKMNINFRTNVKYYFREYIETIDDIPLNKFKCFFLDFVDLGQDNETDTYVFQGSPYANKLTRECSWSMVPIIGIGMQGIEIPLWGNTNFNDTFYPVIYTSKLVGGTLESNVTSARFVMPLRCTKTLNVTVFVKTWSGSNVSNWTTGKSFDTTGTLIIFLNVDDPDPVKSNVYQLAVRINNLNTSNNDAVLFRVFPSSGSISSVLYNTSYTDVFHFATHVELINETNTDVYQQDSPDNTAVLIGWGLVIAGIVIVALTWWTGVGFGVGVSTIAAGVTSATVTVTGIAFAAGVLMITAGSYILIQQGLASGFIPEMLRAILTFIDGLVGFLKAVWNVILQVIEAIKWFINAIMTWGGDILWALAEIIYFVAFVVVLSLWGIFLSTMRYIAVGDAEGAWASLTKPFMKSYRWVRKRPVYKVGKQLALAAATKGASAAYTKGQQIKPGRYR